MATPEQQPEHELPFLAHLVELRDRLIKALLTVSVIFLAGFSYANDIYAIFAGPLLHSLPVGGTMLATAVTSPFLTPFKLTLVLSFYLSIPVILYQLWAFIAPGLYQHEKRLVFPLLVSSVFLFYAGVAFAYFVVMPMVFNFMVAFAPAGVTVAPDISEYLSFSLTMFFAFGVAFEVPIATIVLVWTGMVTPDKLRDARPYIIVGAFFIGMILTPPDVISQTMLAIPMWLLFELGLIFSRFFVRPREESEMEAEDDRRMLEHGEPGPDDHGPGGGGDSPAPATPAAGGGLVFAADDMNEWKQMSPEEMEAELDRIEAEEAAEFERQHQELAQSKEDPTTK